MARSYGTQLWFAVVAGLKSCVTKWVEPMALKYRCFFKAVDTTYLMAVALEKVQIF